MNRHILSRSTRRGVMPITRRTASMLVVVALLVGCGGDPSGSASIVTPTRVSRVDLSPSSVSLGVGATTTMSATAFDQNGQVISGARSRSRPTMRRSRASRTAAR